MAALVSARGQRVCVLPGVPADAAVTVDGQAMEFDPRPFTVAGSPFVRAVFEELGQWLQIRREVAALPGLHHWRLPAGTIDLRGGETNLITESARLGIQASAAARARLTASAHADVLEELRRRGIDTPQSWRGSVLDDAQSDGAGGRGRAREVPPDGRELQDLERLLEPRTLAALLTDASPTCTPSVHAHRVRAMWAEGPHHHVGGTSGLRRQLLERIRFKSSDVKSRPRVAEVELRRGRVQGVRLETRGERYGCDAILLACDPGKLLGERLDPGGLDRAFARGVTEVRRPLRRYVLHLGVAPHGLPAPFSRTLVVSPSAAGADSRGSMLVRRMPVPPVRQHDALVHLSVLNVVDAATPPSELRARTLEALMDRAGLPFLGDHVEWTWSPHDARGLLRRDGRARAIVDTPLSSAVPHAGGRALFAFPGSRGAPGLPVDTGIRRLHYAGRMSHPSLGLEGEFIAAIQAADRIAAPTRRGSRRHR